jgi:hypothetical protein
MSKLITWPEFLVVLPVFLGYWVSGGSGASLVVVFQTVGLAVKYAWVGDI